MNRRRDDRIQPQDLLGKSPSILQGPKTDPKILERLAQEISAGHLFHGRAVNCRKDGSEFMRGWKIAPIRSAADDIRHSPAIPEEIPNPP